jgi:hypothetical protein
MTMDVYGHLIIDKVRQLTRRASHRTLADLLSDLFGVAMAAAFHDVARRDEGKICGTAKAHRCSRLG